MLIIGCDFHTRYQQIAMMDEATGELIERRLQHENGEAAAFYRSLPGLVRVGIEATGPIHWFVRLLTELGHELWIGDSAKIRASEVRKQKTDERDARLILSARNSAGWSCPIAWPISLPCIAAGPLAIIATSASAAATLLPTSTVRPSRCPPPRAPAA